MEERAMIAEAKTSMIDFGNWSLFDFTKPSLIDDGNWSLFDLAKRSMIDHAITSLIDVGNWSLFDLEERAITAEEVRAMIAEEERAITAEKVRAMIAEESDTRFLKNSWSMDERTDHWKGFKKMIKLLNEEHKRQMLYKKDKELYEFEQGVVRNSKTKNMVFGTKIELVCVVLIGALMRSESFVLTIDNAEGQRHELEDVEQELQKLEQVLRCTVCLDKDSCIVFYPCRHMVTCESCERFLQRCPICRSFIEEVVKINEE